MTWIRASKLQPFAQHFCTFTLIFGFTLSVANTALAADCDWDKYAKCKKAKESDKADDASDSCRKEIKSCESSDPCSVAKANYVSAKREVTRQCGDAGFGSSCISTLTKCNDAASSEYISDDEFFAALGKQLGVSGAKGGCPKYSGQGFFERKDKYEKSLDDINDKLNDIKEKNADLNDKFNKDTQEIQEDLQKQQDDLKKKQLDINKEQRERAADMAKTSAEVAATIRKKISENLDVRTKISEIYRSKNSNLIAMTENAAKRACMKKVNELKKEYAAIGAGSLSSGFTAASKKKKELTDTFNECMSQFDVQRAALISQTEEKVQALEMQISNNQSDIDNATQQLSTMESQEQQAKADQATEMTNAQQAYQEKLTRAQTRLTSLAQTTQEKAKALTDKQSYYQTKSKQVSNSIASLGPIPNDETSTTKLSQVQGSYDAYEDAAADRAAACGEDFNALLDRGSDPKDRGSARKGKKQDGKP